MPQTVEVRFKGTRRGFFLWPEDTDPLRQSEAVVVEADRGQDLGRVHSTGDVARKKCSGCNSCATTPPAPEPAIAESLAATEPVEPDTPAREPATAPAPANPDPALQAVLRRATSEDLHTATDLRLAEEEARRHAIEKVRHHKLEMKVSDAEWQWDRSKLTLFFTAEKRVDFRGLVRDLAGRFRTRIELRQIGVRDEAARLNGVGRCGRAYCCSTWLSELSPVSLALAKDQHLSLNPSQISGGCGRLLCCLKYEHEFYVASRKRFPREGKSLNTSRGIEKVIAIDIFRERVFLRNEDGSRIIPLLQLQEELEHPAPVSTALPGPVTPSPRPDHGPDRNRLRRPPEPAARSTPPRPPAPLPQPPPAPATTGEAIPPARRRRRRRGGRGGRGPRDGPAPSGPSEE